MNEKKQDTAHIRHPQHILTSKVAMLSRFLRGFPSRLFANATMAGRTGLFSTFVLPRSTSTNIQVDKITVLPVDNTSVDDTEQARTIPSASYLSIREEAGALQIAELLGDNTATHTQSILTHDEETELANWLHSAAHLRHVKFIAASLNAEDASKDAASKLWLQEDIVPYVISKQDPDYRPDPEEMARMIAANFNKDHIVYTKLSETNEVEVADLVTRADYEKIAVPEDVELLTRLVRDFQGKRLVFINATPQGGGVALMRHALIRLLHLYNVDAHWYVLHPKQEVFDITKAKFHNVLQAVAPEGTELNASDMALYDSWIAENALAFTDIFQQADVIVIDDPQPAGLIPHIRRINPDTKILYRSHIQIVASLANQKGTPQRTTWSFIWNNAKEADCFISHPMEMFIPDDVPADKIFYMPATTDPLDGLNKPLTEEQMDYYLQLFNRMLINEQQKPLDETRPYIIQVARFDPSKGIPDVLDAYKKLRAILEEHREAIPQLVITGNGSIDDPDGVPIYNQIMTILHSPEFLPFIDDVKVMRLPHIDQLLNTLLRRSAVVLQLSTKEGFEVKVTEALMKGKPVIAYRTGGIPLQIEDTVNGYLVDVGHTTGVAEHLHHLLHDAEHYQRMCHAAEELAGKDYLTVPNAICWLYMSMLLLNGENVEGNYQWVKALAKQSQEGA
ncbi:MAG: glycosyltransferase [Ktedonobacteraceae bacterium]|nr:glycosyltransferase [Ktedonobacteraceae bacterium]